ncbi:unnamed protein product [marine sediment metagenome]|uniref:Uncharacterized protein n=1 Tax=marine sediment metagenome TaxID=412755 RepID=X0U994_9ZZZZ
MSVFYVVAKFFGFYENFPYDKLALLFLMQFDIIAFRPLVIKFMRRRGWAD